MGRHDPRGEAPGRLDLLGAAAEGWWEYDDGASRVFVVAAGREEAREKAAAALRDLGVVPGGPRGLHESFERMRDFAKRGRR